MTAAPTLADRILDCFPSGSYALTALLRLMDVVETDAVPTAAVECRVQPRLLVNPGFVGRHAATPEKLLALVMHELHHVLLGHTRLFPTVTPADNFVFDAVINGLVCRMLPQRAVSDFFTDYYPADAFPHCLLRPPPGFPDRFGRSPGLDTLPPDRADAAFAIHAALYSEAGATYEEVRSLLPALLGPDGVAGVPLLSGHSDGSAADGGLEGRSPVLFDVVRGIVEEWPNPPSPLRGRSLAGILATECIHPRRIPSNRAKLRRLIRKVADRAGDDGPRRPTPEPVPVLGGVPAADRRAIVLGALGHDTLLRASPVPVRRRWPSGERVHVYLDVSGSMEGLKDALYGAILDCADRVHPTVHLFSTRIADVRLDELRAGVCRGTGGTDIGCVARHMADNRVRRALVVTDGWVGRPGDAARRTLAAAKLAVAYAGRGIGRLDLADVADATDDLVIEDRRN